MAPQPTWAAHAPVPPRGSRGPDPRAHVALRSEWRQHRLLWRPRRTDGRGRLTRGSCPSVHARTRTAARRSSPSRSDDRGRSSRDHPLASAASRPCPPPPGGKYRPAPDTFLHAHGWLPSDADASPVVAGEQGRVGHTPQAPRTAPTRSLAVTAPPLLAFALLRRHVRPSPGEISRLHHGAVEGDIVESGEDSAPGCSRRPRDGLVPGSGSSRIGAACLPGGETGDRHPVAPRRASRAAGGGGSRSRAGSRPGVLQSPVERGGRRMSRQAQTACSRFRRVSLTSGAVQRTGAVPGEAGGRRVPRSPSRARRVSGIEDHRAGALGDVELWKRYPP